MAAQYPTKSCYVCKSQIVTRHARYVTMCAPCGELNLCKRDATAQLSGRVALVTGARIKIGFQTALKLLRSGASVIATSRFPHDAAARYARESDFGEWRDRLSIYGIDLRHIPSIEAFTDHLCGRLTRLDIIVNNAAQTVRRPPAFYAHLLPGEMTACDALPPALRSVLACDDIGGRMLASEPTRAFEPIEQMGLTRLATDASSHAHLSAQLSQVPALESDGSKSEAYFPPGLYDADGQQVDRRSANSWTFRLDDVSTAELVEVHVINSIAPYMLISRLKGMMERSPSSPRFVVNVTSMEGTFLGFGKSIYHPHTNMAKAALNMLTRTSARDLSKANILMNAVDTGWVTDENPSPLAGTEDDMPFIPPLDVVDGAARVLDPIFTAVATDKRVHGKLFKDYAVRDW